MAQFDVYENPRGGAFPLLLDVQHDILSILDSRIVVPLTPRKPMKWTPSERLNPAAKIAGVDYILVFQDLASVPRAALKDRVTSLASQRPEILGALDLLITGV